MATRAILVVGGKGTGSAIAEAALVEMKRV
jgi:hypothetical protein